MHSHAERGNEKCLWRRSACFSRSHALRGNACGDALRRVLKKKVAHRVKIIMLFNL